MKGFLAWAWCRTERYSLIKCAYWVGTARTHELQHVLDSPVLILLASREPFTTFGGQQWWNMFSSTTPGWQSWY